LPYVTPGNGPSSLVMRLRQRLSDLILADDRHLLAEGKTWEEELGEALERAVTALEHHFGERPSAWRWGAVHQLRPAHPLSQIEPELGPPLDPQGCEMDGDGDTVQAASYHPSSGYVVTSTSVARYLFDLADWDKSLLNVQIGQSGHVLSSHYKDEWNAYYSGRSFPMQFRKIEAKSTLVFRP
jgi:penicillin amidase